MGLTKDISKRLCILSAVLVNGSNSSSLPWMETGQCKIVKSPNFPQESKGWLDPPPGFCDFTNLPYKMVTHGMFGAQNNMVG